MKQKTAEIPQEIMNLSDLKPHPANPNTHPEKQIKMLQHLIKQHGYYAVSITIQKSTGLIIKGHGVREALIKEGYDKALVNVIDCDDSQAMAILVADNKIASDSLIDDIGLQNLINELSDLNVPALDFGFDDTDLQALADRILEGTGGGGEVAEDDFDTEQAIEPISKAGDLWILGNKHRVLCGDSTCKDDVARLMDGKKADVGITDPPYGVRKEEWDDKDNFLTNIKIWFDIYREYSNMGLIWFCADKMLPFLMDKNLFERLLIWNKPAGSQFAGASNNNLWYSHEPILVFNFNGITKNCGTEEYSYSVFDSRTIPESKEGHPTTKPMDLMAWLINHYTKTNQTILDLFLGSGTTLIACEQLGRVCMGIEIDPHYTDVIVKRYIDFKHSADDVFVERNGVKMGYAELQVSV